MARIIASMIVGYIAIAILVFIGLTGAWLLLGADRAYEPGVYDLTPTWGMIAVAVNLVAALVGGIVCASIARTRRAPKIFAIIVFVLGVLVAIPALLPGENDPAPARPADITMTEAMKNARQPTWFALLNPVTAAVGIMVGASLVGERSGARRVRA